MAGSFVGLVYLGQPNFFCGKFAGESEKVKLAFALSSVRQTPAKFPVLFGRPMGSAESVRRKVSEQESVIQILVILVKYWKVSDTL